MNIPFHATLLKSHKSFGSLQGFVTSLDFFASPFSCKLQFHGRIHLLFWMELIVKDPSKFQGTWEHIKTAKLVNDPGPADQCLPGSQVPDGCNGERGGVLNFVLSWTAGELQFNVYNHVVNVPPQNHKPYCLHPTFCHWVYHVICFGESGSLAFKDC